MPSALLATNWKELDKAMDLRLEKLQRLTVPATVAAESPSSYPGEPVKYAERILKIKTLTDDQKNALEHLYKPPRRVLMPSAHDVGKTFLAAVAVNHWYDSYPDDGVALTTAPTERDVVDLLWTEVRIQRYRAELPSDFIGARAPEMRTSDTHYAKGYTARKGESFQGRHRKRMLFVFDEANGIDPIYWETTRTMFDPSLEHSWLAIFNPTDTTSQAYLEDHRWSEDEDKRWHRFQLSALTHPNVLNELKGKPKDIPGAVSLAMVNEWVKDWCDPIVEHNDATDVEWPPGSGKWYKPGPIFQARAQGCWPDTGSGVWGDALFDACLRGPQPPWPMTTLPEIGVDCAMGKGDDFHAIHCHWGATSFHHEASNTMDPVRIYGRLKELCAEAAALVTGKRHPNAKPIAPQQIRVNLDDDGTGNAVAALLRREGYATCLLGAGSASTRPDLYPNKRSELWFAAAAKAKAGGVYLGNLPRVVQHRLRQQLLAPEWDLDNQGRRKVEPKADTKEKIGRSPDDADAFNLSHWASPNLGAPTAVEAPRQERRGNFPGVNRR